MNNYYLIIIMINILKFKFIENFTLIFINININ